MRALVLVAVAACYQPRPCEIKCTTECPTGMTCVAGLCTDGQMCTSPPPATDYASVAVGARHACALTTDRELYCWGDNSQGQLGVDVMGFASTPTRVGDSGVAWTSISAGLAHTCGIHDGRVFCWGANEKGQVTGSQVSVTEPITEVVLGIPMVEQIAAGATHTCALGGGQLWCWGDPTMNGAGAKLGQVPGMWDAVAVASEHTCAIAGDIVKCWGNNAAGELGTGDNMNHAGPTIAVQELPATPIRIAVGDYVSCAIVGAPGDTQGQLWCWGNDDVRQIDPMIGDNAVHAVQLGIKTDWTAIEIGVDTLSIYMPVKILGHQRLCGIRGGMVSCWGAAPPGGAGNGLWDALSTGPDQPVAGAAADAIALGHAGPGDDVACLLDHGSISCWGDNRYGELGIGVVAMEATPVEVAGRWDAVRSGHHHTCAMSAGALSCWGADDAGQVNAGHAVGGTAPCMVDDCDALAPVAESSPIDHPTDIVAGDDFSCVRTNGDVHCWGSDAFGQLGVETVVSPITTVSGAWSSLTGGDRIACGACGGTCYQCWGVVAGVVTRLPTIPPSSPYDELHAGENFVCGVKAETRYCWGENGSGQLGDGTTLGPKTTPENLENLVMHVATAGLHGCALYTDGTVACWGSNAFGESAQPISAAEPSVRDIGLTGCTAISVASHYGCAICSDTPVCWGSNANGELGRGTTSRFEIPARVNVPTALRFTEIVTGETRACALEESGRLFCWGYGPRGELGTGGHGTNLPTPLAPRN